jgi:hypothetical protein
LSQPATIGRLTQVCDRWIYTTCLCFGLDLAEQQRSGFIYGYSVYQAEYSRTLLFTIGAQMDRVFDRIVDRTRSRLDVPILRTLFGAKQRPGRNGTPDLSLKLAAVIETPRYDLTLFKLHFGNLTLKAYTKGEHGCASKRSCTTPRRCAAGVLDNFPHIIARLADMVERFTTTLDCVDSTFIADGLLDRLPAPAQLGATRVDSSRARPTRRRDQQYRSTPTVARPAPCGAARGDDEEGRGRGEQGPCGEELYLWPRSMGPGRVELRDGLSGNQGLHYRKPCCFMPTG